MKGGVIDNNKEILDIIDENDDVIGQMSKKDIHEGNKIRHREIAVLIYDSNGNLLLQQRSKKKHFNPGKWTVSAIGHVLSGQTPEQAAHRELEEELGFDTKVVFAERRSFDYENHASYGFIYTGEFPKHVMIKPDKDELERAGFFTKKQVQKMIEEDKIGGYSKLTITNFLSGKYPLKNSS